MPKRQVAENLQVYLQRPELVDGWITPDAVALKDGSVMYTQYFKTPRGGLILRAALEPHEPESPQGLFHRFEAGERFVPEAMKLQSGQVLKSGYVDPLDLHERLDDLESK